MGVGQVIKYTNSLPGPILGGQVSAEPLDLPSAPVDDEVVLDAVALLLAAVELPLPLGILGALDGALHSVDDGLESLAFAQHRLEVAGLAGWELLLVTECRMRNGVRR